jgi:LPS sulfotransferase NodH
MVLFFNRQTSIHIGQICYDVSPCHWYIDLLQQEVPVQPRCSYLICATPRSGSTLLCEALINTGLAGRPEEYFEALKESGRPRRPLEYFTGVEDADLIELLGDSEGPPPAHPAYENYAEYLASVIERGTTPNGVFGAKVMWEYLDDFISNLRTIPHHSSQPVPQLLASIFPHLHYIMVIRRDKVRQAVSLWKALQTQAWKLDEDEHPGEKVHHRPLTFHFGAIDHLKQRLEAHEAAWQQYFAQNNIEPFTVVYEDFVPAYEETARQILSYLGISAPDRPISGPRRMKQQADALSEQWIQLYYEQRRAEEVEQY